MKSFKKCHQAISEKIYQMNSVKIKEIFSSIQGEGRYIGYKQLFIRFAGCNLGCKYCDTDYSLNENYREYTVQELVNEAAKYTDIHSVSLTGGEPLMSVEFLKEFLPKVEKKIYLETNATLFNELKEIKRYVDIISADIKLKSATGLDTKELHNKFFEACSGIETFAKIVFKKIGAFFHAPILSFFISTSCFPESHCACRRNVQRVNAVCHRYLYGKVAG